MSTTQSPSTTKATRITLKSVFWRFDVLGFFLCIGLVSAWPNMDLTISSWFYDAKLGGFFLKHSAIADTVYMLTGVLGSVIALTLLTLITFSYCLKSDFHSQHRKTYLFLFCAFALGPGLLVHQVIKDHWERPRPNQVSEFGGLHEFESPLAPTFECTKCQSFVSGHASVGFFFFAFALLMGRRKWYLLAIAAGGIIGLVRIIQGGHFFSDIVFCGWVVWFNTLFLHWVFFRKQQPQSRTFPIILRDDAAALESDAVARRAL